ncbi:hypothetical protein JY425_19520, partial [Stenotrophomonas maltophilia]|nr:hypothetical protein [Stenotrophomonas maltophilia]
DTGSWGCRPAAGTTIEGALCAGTQSALRFASAVVVPAAGRHQTGPTTAEARASGAEQRMAVLNIDW